jgi:hypothetical protein
MICIIRVYRCSLLSDANMAQSHVKNYQAILRDFMQRRDDAFYPERYEFENDDVVTITADEICQYLFFQAYGTSEPGVNDLPTYTRSSSLHFYKKPFHTLYQIVTNLMIYSFVRVSQPDLLQ